MSINTIHVLALPIYGYLLISIIKPSLQIRLYYLSDMGMRQIEALSWKELAKVNMEGQRRRR